MPICSVYLGLPLPAPGRDASCDCYRGYRGGRHAEGGRPEQGQGPGRPHEARLEVLVPAARAVYEKIRAVPAWKVVGAVAREPRK